jgi:hypothetical protein
VLHRCQCKVCSAIAFSISWPLRGLFVGRDDDPRDLLDRIVQRGEEAILAILEDLVERSPRDTRATHNVSDRDIGGGFERL